MVSFDTPAPYPDRFVPGTTPWYRELFNPGRDLQTAEVNEIQSMADYKLALLGDGLFAPGTFISGGNPTVSAAAGVITVSINPGKLWADATHLVPGGSVVITGIGTEVISLLITETVITAADDSTLNDPVSTAENYGYPGADRLVFTYAYALNAPQGIPVVTLIDGQIVQSQNSSGFLDQLYAILAQRTYEQSGSFVAVRPALTIIDIANISTNPIQMALQADGGVVYNQGYRLANTGKITLNLIRPLTGQPQVNEPITPISGTKIYSIDNAPLLAMDSISATVPSPNISMTRGLTVNGSDAVPSQYLPIALVVSVVQGGTTYHQGTDFNRSGNFIVWINGGNQPATGSTYTLVVDYTYTMVKGVRTLMSVSNETHTVPSSGTTTLAHTNLRGSTVVIVDTTTNITLAYGTIYTVAASTGVITWVAPPVGHTVQVSYSYWAHTIEGDYVSRDSFVDSTGDVLLNETPGITPSGLTVNYLNEFSLDVINGNVPVTGIDFYINYHYTLGRVDVLAWHSDGIIEIVQGVPGVSPAAVNLDTSYVPLAKLLLPPEAVASEVTIEWYNNLTLLVTDLQQLNQQVQTIQYNIGVFQLQQAAANVQTATNKRGLFADNFSTPILGDLANSLFAGTYDFLAYTFSLPRTQGAASPTVSSSTGATLYNDVWMLNFSEIPAIAQSYRSRAQVINQYGSVNQRAKVSVSPNIAIVNTSSLLVEANAHNQGFTPGNMFEAYSSQALLLTEVSQSGAAAASLGNSAGQLANSILNKVPVDPAWLNNSTSSAQNVTSGTPWATVLTTIDVVTGTPLPTTTLTLTASNFRPNDRAISCALDGNPISITPTGSTVAETNAAYPGCVEASGLGNWTGTIQTPANLLPGLHTLTFAAHNASNLGAITSLSSTTFRTGGVSTSVEEFVTLTALPKGYPCAYVPALYLCAVLGFNMNWNIAISTSGPMSYTIAYAVAAANQLGISLTTDLIQTAIEIFLGCTRLISATSVVGPQFASAISPTSTNVTQMVAQLTAANPAFANTAIGPVSYCELDPLAQTFTLGGDSFVTSIDLFFATTPVDPVAVALATVVDGIPTTDYLSITYLQPTSISTSGKTTFEFDKPIFCSGGIEYAFIVLTNDSLVSVWSAALGDTDVNTGQLIISDPASGTLLDSSNGSTWSPIQGQDLQFNVNVANFITTEGILNFGLISFTQASSIIAFYMPFDEPSQDTTVTYQYSFDNATWIDFPLLVEKDFGLAANNFYLRVLLSGTSAISPVVFNYTSLLYYIWQAAGCYTHLEFDLPNADCRYVDVYANLDLPGNTSAAFYVSFNHGSTWNLMTEVTADLINLNTIYYQHHFTYDSGSAANQQFIKTKCVLTSTVDYITPKIQDYIVIAR